MDSEQSAFITAQQKHHRFMIFGKKQRYIEVFQCSGDDMNMVLTGGIPAPVSPAKPAPALLSPGMLPSLAPLPPTNIPPPPTPSSSVPQVPQNLVPQTPTITWENSTLLAQQQAQMIAQQNLIARQNQAQAQNEHIMLMNQITQHNLAVLNQNVRPLSPTSTQLQSQVLKPPPPLPVMPHILPQPPFVFIPRVTPLGIPRHPLYHQQLMAAPNHTAGVIPVVPHVAMKRSYGDAFADQANVQAASKRAYQPPGTLPVYHQFYPNI